MIAFASEPRTADPTSSPTLILGPRLVFRSPDTRPGPPDVTECDCELVASQIAQRQTELAILRRALVRCGLTGQSAGAIKQ